jgi:hypothetical protein
MNFNSEKIYWHFKRNSWYVPLLIAVAATPFMIIAVTTKDSGLETIAKIVWLLLLLVLIGYNLMIRTLRRKFEGSARP